MSMHACVHACVCEWAWTAVYMHTHILYIFSKLSKLVIYIYINDLLCFAVVCGFKNYYRGQ